MLNRLFGNYLVDKKRLTLEQLDALLPVKKDFKAGAEVVAIATKAMAPAAVKQVLADKNEYFGEAAVNAGYITDMKLDEILERQSNNFMKFLRLLVDADYISYSDINHEMDEFQKKNGLNDEQMDALINDDLERCIDIFVPMFKTQELKRFARIFVQTFRRIIDEDMYLEKADIASAVQLDKYAGQMLEGDFNIKVYISACDDGLLAIANHFTGETYNDVTEDALDGVGEFINCVNGLFATEMSYEGVSIDMRSPEYAIEGPFVSGEKFYVIPVHANGYDLRVIVEAYYSGGRK